MANQSRLKAIYQRIEDGIERESWQEARSGLRELARILVDATIVADNEFVAQIDELVAQIFLDVSLDDAFEAELSLNSIGWSADGLRDVSQLARKRRPPMTSEQRAATLKDAEARVLACLGEGNAGPKSNREIADKLDLHVKADGNALFLARVTHDARREIIWRIHDPERANAILLGVLSRKDYPRPFEHRIDDDSAWTKAAWYLDNLPVDR